MSVKRSRTFAISERRQLVAKLYLQGRSQAEIAQELKITQATVSKDMTHTEHGWQQSAIRDFDAQRAQEIAKLNLIEQEAFGGWERSRQPTQTAVVNGAAGAQSARRTVKHQYGDPRFLDIILRCNEERRKILGLDAPTKIAPVTPDGRPLTLEQRRTHIFAILKEQLSPQALANFTEVLTYGPATNPEAPGKHDGPGVIEAQPAGNDEEPLPAPAAG